MHHSFLQLNYLFFTFPLASPMNLIRLQKLKWSNLKHFLGDSNLRCSSDSSLLLCFNVITTIKMAARSKTWVCGLSLAGIVHSNLAGHVYLSLLSVVCCQVAVSASGWSLVRRSPTECGVSECDRESSRMRRPWSPGGCCVLVKKKSVFTEMRHWRISWIYFPSSRHPLLKIYAVCHWT